MVTVLKAGGSSLTDQQKINRILEQTNGLDELAVLTVSAQGKTTDRIVKAIEMAHGEEKVPEPDEIFQEFVHLDLGKMDARETGIRDSIFGMMGGIRKKYDHFRASTKNEQDRARVAFNEPAYTATLHLCGERLAALGVYLLSKQLQESYWIDLMEDGFPLAVKGPYHGARIDMDKSRENAQKLLRSIKKGVLILPAYGGLDLNWGSGRKPRMKTLGRDGSDTAAFGQLYAFRGDRLLILTDVEGVLDANIEGGKTVPVLDIEEARDAADLGAKLPGSVALEGLERYYEEGGRPEVRITHNKNFYGPGTNILYETKEKVPVKLVAGRNVVIYGYRGDVRGLSNVLDASGISWHGTIKSGFLGVVVAQENAPYLERITEDYFQRRGRKNEVRRKIEDNLALVGAVGSGMAEPDVTDIGDRGSGALGKEKINVRYYRDPGPVSLGYIVGRDVKGRAIEALYRELLAKV